MRVIKTGAFVTGDVSTLELHDIDPRKERYAILSHTWGAAHDEVLFTDLLQFCDAVKRTREGVISVDLTQEAAQHLRLKPGWAKLAFALEQAEENHKNWLWVDSACIDRTSSAELTSAVNCMYDWYENSAVCYAYLSDVPLGEWRKMKRESTLRTRWTNRAWTLQELLAPGHVVFFSSEWARLGDKHELATALAHATRIDVNILNGSEAIEDQCIAKRMSWASHRDATIEEDIAYCLMGLFGVNMPVLYGEGGKKAFLRLQQEIIKASDDQSIFLWKDPLVGDTPHGLLADGPHAFAHATNYRSYGFEEQPPFYMINHGLRLSLHLSLDKDKNYIAALQCPNPFSKDGYLGIHLRKLPSGDKQYARIRCDEISSLDTRGTLEEIFVRQTISPMVLSFTQRNESSTLELNRWNGVMPTHVFHVQKLRAWGDQRVLDVQFLPPKRSLDKDGLNKDLVRPPNIPDNFPVTFKMAKEDFRITAAILLGQDESDSKKVAVLLGSKVGCEPGYDIVECSDLASLKDLKRPFDPMDLGTMAFSQHYRVMVKAEMMTRNDDIKVFLLEIGIGGVEKTIKYQDRDRLERVDSMRSTASNGSRMSLIMNKIARRYSHISE